MVICMLTAIRLLLTFVMSLYLLMRSFFFQAEDGIRDRNVTGVQTCALPILRGKQDPRKESRKDFQSDGGVCRLRLQQIALLRVCSSRLPDCLFENALSRGIHGQIGRASCREKVVNLVLIVELLFISAQRPE